MDKDYYQILEVHPQASPEMIHSAYRALVRKYHPDVYHSQHKAPMAARMQDINEAYQILSQASTRAAYDQQYPGIRQRAANAPDARTSRRPAAGQGRMRVVRLLAWGIGTYVLLKLAGPALLANPISRVILLVLLVMLAVRIYRYRKHLSGGPSA